MKKGIRKVGATIALLAGGIVLVPPVPGVIVASTGWHLYWTATVVMAGFFVVFGLVELCIRRKAQSVTQATASDADVAADVVPLDTSVPPCPSCGKPRPDLPCRHCGSWQRS